MTDAARTPDTAPDTARAIAIANDAEDVLDMYEAASLVQGVAAEAIRLSSEQQRDWAVELYKDYRLTYSDGQHNGILNPEVWAERAARNLAAGGYLVALSAEATPDRTANQNLALFRAKLREIQQPQPSDTIEAKEA